MYLLSLHQSVFCNVTYLLPTPILQHYAKKESFELHAMMKVSSCGFESLRNEAKAERHRNEIIAPER